MTVTLKKEEWYDLRRHYEQQVFEVLTQVAKELSEELNPSQALRLKLIFKRRGIEVPPSPFDDLPK